MAKQAGVGRAMGEQFNLVTILTILSTLPMLPVSGAELPGMIVRSSLPMTTLLHGVLLCFLSMHAGSPRLGVECSFPVPYNSDRCFLIDVH